MRRLSVNVSLPGYAQTPIVCAARSFRKATDVPDSSGAYLWTERIGVKSVSALGKPEKARLRARQGAEKFPETRIRRVFRKTGKHNLWMEITVAEDYSLILRNDSKKT
jgi:hypothetical protein